MPRFMTLKVFQGVLLEKFYDVAGVPGLVVGSAPAHRRYVSPAHRRFKVSRHAHAQLEVLGVEAQLSSNSIPAWLGGSIQDFNTSRSKITVIRMFGAHAQLQVLGVETQLSSNSIPE